MSGLAEAASDRTWFLQQLAEIMGYDAAAISPQARLVEDLGFDSPAFAELVVLAFERYGVDIGDDGPEWLTLPVGELHAALVTARGPLPSGLRGEDA
jgi:hypothetical protein